MIKISDALKLSLTKFRTLRVRAILSIAIPAALFAIILTGVTMMHGLQNTVAEFNSEGLGGRFLVSAYNDIYNQSLTSDSEEYIETVEKLYKERVAKNKQTAKDLGIAYYESFDPSPINSQWGLKYVSGWTADTAKAREILSDSYAANSEDILRVSAAYNPTGIFVWENRIVDGGDLFVMEDGVENFDKLKPRDRPDDSMASFFGRGFGIADDSLAQPFITSQKKSFSDSIPVIVTHADAENILRLKPLPTSATADEKIDRILEIHERLTDERISVCFRNKASVELVNLALFPDKDAPVSYKLSDEPCAPVAVDKDARSDEEKTFAENMTAFKKAVGEYETPWQQTIEYTIIGFTPNSKLTMATHSLMDLVHELAGSSLSDTTTVPRGYLATFADQELLDDIFSLHKDSTYSFFGMDESFVLEFANRKDAENFIKDNSCEQTTTGCATYDKPFRLDFYGSNSAVVDELFSGIMRIILIALVIVIAFLALLLVSIITKIISGSRKEIAVFRALGFTRPDIVAIYQTYAIIFALFIVALTSVASLAASAILSSVYSEKLTSELRTLFSSIDFEKSVVLFSPNVVDFAILFMAIIILAIICCSVPALLAVKRNPIKDLRAE